MDRLGLRAPEETRIPGSIDHAARAEQRLAEIRAQFGDDLGGGEVYFDKFYAEAPPGWVYNWKTLTVFNKEYPQYQSALRRNFWEPVPADRHRELLYPEYMDAFVVVEGMILMERPKSLNDERVALEKRRAMFQIEAKEAQLGDAPPGTAPRDKFAETRPSINRHVGPVVPD